MDNISVVLEFLDSNGYREYGNMLADLLWSDNPDEEKATVIIASIMKAMKDGDLREQSTSIFMTSIEPGQSVSFNTAAAELDSWSEDTDNGESQVNFSVIDLKWEAANLERATISEGGLSAAQIEEFCRRDRISSVATEYGCSVEQIEAFLASKRMKIPQSADSISKILKVLRFNP